MDCENILVITVDGLRAAALGGYGNTWYDTPHLDRLAAESMLCEWCFATGVSLPDIFRSLWLGQHPLRPETKDARSANLMRRLADLGYCSILITDEPQLADLPGANDFDQIQSPESGPRQPATDLADTQIASLFASVVDEISNHRAKQLVWLHARGFYGAWDAPLELRHAPVEEGDPEPYDGCDPPSLHIDSRSDPDLRFRYACSYAAGVQVLDTCLGLLADRLNRSSGQTNWLTLLAGTRGYPLGEHGAIGGDPRRLHAEQVHVPLLIHSADRAFQLQRSALLAEHADIPATILARVAGDRTPLAVADGRSLLAGPSTPAAPWRDHSVAFAGQDSRAVRTPGWCWLSPPGDTADDENPTEPESTEQLFVRPDDRWEANDVHKLCPEIAAGLKQAAEQFWRHCQHGEALQPLERALVEHVD